MLGMLDLLDHGIPFTQVRRTGLEMEQAHDQLVQPFLPEHDRHFIDRIDVLGRDDRVFFDVTEHGDLALEFRRKIPIGPAEENMRLDTDFPQLVDGMLRRFGLQLPGRSDVGHQREMDIQHVLTADVVGHLSNRFEKWQALDIADRAADLHDRDVHPLRDTHDALFDFVGHVGHHLDSPAKVIAATFFADDRMVNPAGRVVVFFGQSQGRVPLIVAQVEVGLRTVVRHIDFSMLIGIHRAGIDVDVGIELEKCDLQPPAFEQVADRG